MLRIRIFKKVVELEEEKNGKKVKRTFNAFYTKMNLVVKGEEEKGKQEKWVNVKFRKECDTSKLKSGYLIINDHEDINAPFKYEIRENEDGSVEYPTIWIKNYDDFKPVVVKHEQNEFVSNDEETESFED